MASAGYGVEATIESLWGESWETSEFGYWNVMIGTQFNGWILGTPATDTTNAEVKEWLKQETHYIFGLVNALVKQKAVTNPWEFMAIWYEKTLAGDNFQRRYRNLIKRCQDVLFGRFEMSTMNLPGANNRTY